MPLYSNWRLKVMERNQGEPLPFPPAGGCWSPLVDYVPETASPGLPLHRWTRASFLFHTEPHGGGRAPSAAQTLTQHSAGVVLPAETPHQN